MKLLSLNIQGGAQSPKFLKYIEQQKKTIDTFCFQEVFDSKLHIRTQVGENMDIYGQLKKELKEFTSYFWPVSSRVGKYFKLKNKVILGLSIFIKKGFKTGKHYGFHVEGAVDSEVNFKEGREANAVQCLEINMGDKNFWIINFHGVSRPGDKLDTPKRLKQSKKIINGLSKLVGPKILCGDFNLMPKTESIKIIERAGLINLISKYKIKNTRNTISWNRYHNRQCFADFTFVSKEIKQKSFKVPYTLASDHLPMILEFDLK